MELQKSSERNMKRCHTLTTWLASLLVVGSLTIVTDTHLDTWAFRPPVALGPGSSLCVLPMRHTFHAHAFSTFQPLVIIYITHAPSWWYVVVTVHRPRMESPSYV